MDKKLIPIPKKGHQKGEDGYKTFSVRVREETVTSLERIASESGRSRNELINIILEYAISNYEIVG